MTKVANYTHKPTRVQAIFCKEDNMHEVARWCGGTIEHASQAGSLMGYFGFGKIHKVVVVPGVDTNVYLEPGNWLVRDLANGRYFTCDQEFFRANYETDWRRPVRDVEAETNTGMMRRLYFENPESFDEKPEELRREDIHVGEKTIDEMFEEALKGER